MRFRGALSFNRKVLSSRSKVTSVWLLQKAAPSKPKAISNDDGDCDLSSQTSFASVSIKRRINQADASLSAHSGTRVAQVFWK